MADVIETKAIKQVFGERALRDPGEFDEVDDRALAGRRRRHRSGVQHPGHSPRYSPPTINLDHPDPECDLDYVPHKARPATVNVALSNSFGFGGVNACLLFKKPEA